MMDTELELDAVGVMLMMTMMMVVCWGVLAFVTARYFSFF